MADSWFEVLLFIIPLLAPLSLLPAPITWTLLEDVAKVRISFIFGAAIPFMTFCAQLLAFWLASALFAVPFSKTLFVLASVGVAAAQYFVFRNSLRQRSGQPIRPIHALLASVINVAVCTLMLGWVIL